MLNALKLVKKTSNLKAKKITVFVGKRCGEFFSLIFTTIVTLFFRYNPDSGSEHFHSKRGIQTLWKQAGLQKFRIRSAIKCYWLSCSCSRSIVVLIIGTSFQFSKQNKTFSQRQPKTIKNIFKFPDIVKELRNRYNLHGRVRMKTFWVKTVQWYATYLFWGKNEMEAN